MNFKAQVKKKNSDKKVNLSELLDDSDSSNKQYLELSWDSFIADPDQPRKTFDAVELEELRHSIEQHGQLQPILVRPHNEDSRLFVIIAGERRWKAIQSSETVSKLKAIVQNEDDELKLLLMQIDENDKRQSISVIETAGAIKRVVELVKATGGRQKDAADKLNISTAQISKFMSILKGPSTIHQMSHANETQDIEVLYCLAKAYEINPEKTDQLINKYRDGSLKEGLRKASKGLLEFLKNESKSSEPQGSELQGSELQGSELQGSEPQGSEPQGSEPQGSELQGSEPQGSEPQGSEDALIISELSLVDDENNVYLIVENGRKLILSDQALDLIRRS